MNYERPMSWYEPDEEFERPTDYGWVREEELPDMTAIQDYLEGIIEALYKTGNVSRIEGCLEELCHIFDISFEPGNLQVEKKKKSDLMQWYLGYQRAQIDQMNHTELTVQDYTKEVNHG